MVSDAACTPLPAEAPPLRPSLDRRRHPRFNVALLGRFMRSNKREYPCKLVDISVAGAAMNSPVELDKGERIVAYFDHLGGLEGEVVRSFPGGFAVTLSATRHKREKLAASLTWLINRNAAPGIDLRRDGHDRFTIAGSELALKVGEGLVVSCQIRDVSISGAALITAARPAPGSEVMVGRLRARVARHHEQGIAVEFVDIQNPDALRRYFG